MSDDKRGFDIKNYALGFLVFSLSVAISFFAGFRIGKNIAREELRKEVMKAREEGLEEILGRIFEKAEKKSGVEFNLPPTEKIPEKKSVNQGEKTQNLETEKSAKLENTENFEDVSTGSSAVQGSKLARGSEVEKISSYTGAGAEKSGVESQSKSADKTISGKSGNAEVRKEDGVKGGGTALEDKSKGGDKDKASLGKGNYDRKFGAEKTAEQEVSLRGENWWEEGGKWSVQVASFTSDEKAREFVRNLKVNYGFPAYVVKGAVNGKTVWRVRVGKLKDRGKAEKLLNALKSKGFNGVITF